MYRRGREAWHQFVSWNWYSRWKVCRPHHHIASIHRYKGGGRAGGFPGFIIDRRVLRWENVIGTENISRNRQSEVVIIPSTVENPKMCMKTSDSCFFHACASVMIVWYLSNRSYIWYLFRGRVLFHDRFWAILEVTKIWSLANSCLNDCGSNLKSWQTNLGRPNHIGKALHLSRFHPRMKIMINANVKQSEHLLLITLGVRGETSRGFDVPVTEGGECCYHLR